MSLKQIFHRLKISHKLDVVIVFATTLGITLAISGFYIYDQNTQKKVLENELLILSQVTAERSSAALLFSDKKTALDNLSSLHLKHTILLTCMYNKSDQVFASVKRNKPEVENMNNQPLSSLLLCPDSLPPHGVYFEDDSVEVFTPIKANENKIGTIFVYASLQDIRERQTALIIVVSTISVLALIVTLLLTKPLKNRITKPIIDLGHIAKRIDDKEDYSIRATTENEDETGITVNAFNNMLSKIEQHSLELTKLAYFDTLTGLANRRKFRDDLENLMKNKKSENEKIALMFIDLDKFKPINDNLGHDVGDLLLEEVGKRLTASMPENGEAYRLGGDEFTVILKHIKENTETTNIAEKILVHFAKKTVISNHNITISASIGIAISDNEMSIDQIMKNADQILYEVKASGRNGYKIAS